MEDDDVVFNRNSKFDIQLSASLVRERALGEIFVHAIFDGTRPVKIELKSETWQWEQTGNICIEYSARGQPSGIAATKADVWVHELRRDGQTLCWIMFPLERLKELARKFYHNGGRRENGGDNGQFCNIVIPLSEILK